MTKCQCTEPGWCERHQCYKDEHFFHICQTHEGYFQKWEEGRGPGQVDPSGHHSVSAVCNCGCQLKHLLAKFWIVNRAGCQCAKHADQMDQWGPDKCLQRMDTILAWMEKEAQERQLPFTRKGAKAMVRIAIWRAKRAIKKAEEKQRDLEKSPTFMPPLPRSEGESHA